jgi:hypothetical protein
MTLKEARILIDQIECDHRLENATSIEKEIGKEVKFITFSANFGDGVESEKIIEELRTKYGFGYLDIKKVKKVPVNFSVSIKIDNGNGKR